MPEPTLDQVLQRLRTLNEPVPKPLRLPTVAEIADVEHRLGVAFHRDYRKYLLQASDVVYGTKEPATITAPGSHTDLAAICKHAWEGWGVPRHLLPICEDNADFYCMNAAGEVVFWSHNGQTDERWPNLATWINDVWIEEA
jgi:SMI1-KNR4 cell-wall